MRIEDWPEYEMPENAGFASLAGVSVRRSGTARGKKSDITDTLASMRATPEYLRPESAPVQTEMRDVTPPVCTDIVDYWENLRVSTALPSSSCLKASELAPRWPNLILFRCGPTGNFAPDTAFATAIRANRAQNDAGSLGGGVEMTAMLSQWLLAAVRNAATRATPFRERSSFDTSKGPIAYEVAAVPFGERGVDHVLCNVDRA